MVKRLDKVDVVTVGVGWTGGIVATELTKAGYNVVGLEKGANRTLEDYLHIHDELKYSERRALFQDLSKDTVTFRNDIGQRARPIRNQKLYAIGEGVGGGASHWGAQTQRWFPYDFEIRSRTIERYGENKIPDYMTIRDWGITYDELEPYYDKMEKMAAVSGEDDPLGGPRSDDFPTPPKKHTPAMKLFREASEKLGYHPFVIPEAIASENYTNPDGVEYKACQYCAFCGFYGCEWKSKADPAYVLVPVAKETGKYDLRTHAFVKRVLYDGDKATGVLYVDTRTGEEFEQPADLVVLTGYTFSNVRLLLLSEIGTPYNPETGEGIIGKNFLEHHNVTGARGFFEDQKFNSYVGTGTLGVAYNDFNADNFDHSNVEFLHGGQIEFHQRGIQPISFNPVPEGTPTWGREFKEKSIYYTYRTLEVASQRAVLPSRYNYVDLDPTYKDAFGDPLLRVTYEYTDNDRKLNDFVVEKTAEVLEAMGADRIEKGKMAEHNLGAFTFMHNGGGAIMGTDPADSAVNTYLQSWDMDNLFVVGASAFPHFGQANPTATVDAITYRATEGMIKYLKEGAGLLV